MRRTDAPHPIDAGSGHPSATTPPDRWRGQVADWSGVAIPPGHGHFPVSTVSFRRNMAGNRRSATMRAVILAAVPLCVRRTIQS